MHSDPSFSVLLPAKNEAANLAQLLAEIRTACGEGDHYEVILVNDGSTDTTLAELQQVAASGFRALRVLDNTSSVGQSTSIYRAARAAGGWSRWMATARMIRRISPACWP